MVELSIKKKIHTELTVTECSMRDSNYSLAGSLLDKGWTIKLSSLCGEKF